MGRVRRVGETDPESPNAVEKKPPIKRRKNPPKKRDARGYKYDWEAVKAAFVEGFKDPNNPDERLFVNLKDLSERMDVPIQSIRERSADERWYDQRQVYQMKLVKTRQAKRIAELSKESVDFDAKSLNVAKLGIAVITARMSEIARDVQDQSRKREETLKLAAAGFIIDPKDLDTVVDARELDTISRAAIQFQQLGQKAMGTDIQKIDINHEIQGQIDIDVEVTSVAAELGRDDPERLAAFLQAAKRAGLLDTVIRAQDDDGNQLAIESSDEEDDVIEAEIVGGDDE